MKTIHQLPCPFCGRDVMARGKLPAAKFVQHWYLVSPTKSGRSAVCRGSGRYQNRMTPTQSRRIRVLLRELETDA